MPALKARIEKSADAFRSIGEAAAELGLETHVLRYWESKFPREVRPVKREDGRRLFRPQDMDGLRAIQVLVHQKGMTLKGAKAILAEQGVDAVLSGAVSLTPAELTPAASPARQLQETVAKAFSVPRAAVADPGKRHRLEGALLELTDLKARIDAALLHRAA